MDRFCYFLIGMCSFLNFFGFLVFQDAAKNLHNDINKLEDMSLGVAMIAIPNAIVFVLMMVYLC